MDVGAPPSCDRITPTTERNPMVRAFRFMSSLLVWMATDVSAGLAVWTSSPGKAMGRRGGARSIAGPTGLVCFSPPGGRRHCGGLYPGCYLGGRVVALEAC